MNFFKKSEEKKGGYIPSMSQLRSLLASLPDPAKTFDETHEIRVDDNPDKTLRFERAIIRKSDGSKSPRWVYKGRIFIDSKYYTNAKK